MMRRVPTFGGLVAKSGSARAAGLRPGRRVLAAASVWLPGTALAQSPPVEMAPAAGAAPAAAPVMGADAATLPHDFSILAMFLNADVVVQSVMVGLVLASVLTWMVLVAKGLQLLAARRAARATRLALRGVRSLDEAERYAGARGATERLITEAGVEMDLSQSLPAEGIKERVASRLERVEAQAGRRIASGIGILATIGSTAPFVGLFGTVWGIMNSFVGISKAQTTNLAVVAPGIAEALLATGIGLVAAIPAVVFYNLFTRWIAGYRAELADSSAEIMRLVSRDLDRRERPAPLFAEAAQ